MGRKLNTNNRLPKQIITMNIDLNLLNFIDDYANKQGKTRTALVTEYFTNLRNSINKKNMGNS